MQKRRGVFGRVGREPVLEHAELCRLAFEEPGEGGDRVTVGDAGRNVRPLPGVGTLREQAAKPVEARRMRAQDPVRVLVDERNAAQYFSKWPSCSNVSSPSE